MGKERTKVNPDRQRRIRLLAVASYRRNPVLPDLPTTGEAGLADYAAGALSSVFTTGKTPSDVVRRLNSEINGIVASSEVSKRLVALGVDPGPKTVEECTRQYLANLALWKDVVARAKIPLEN